VPVKQKRHNPETTSRKPATATIMTGEKSSMV
jgi:hypothetical protein